MLKRSRGWSGSRTSPDHSPLLGPAFVAAVAYIDPGNFATNITAGSQFGYLLIWVLVVSNLMAMLIQYLSAKAGIATGKSLPELCRDNFPRPVTRGLWVQAELVAIATDLAEVLGGAIALRLLFDLPLLVGGVITAVVAFGLLGLQTRGARPFEVAITGMLLVVLVGFGYSLVVGGVDARLRPPAWSPDFEGTETVLLAAGMLGATVMPHVIYLHGALTQNRYVRSTEEERLAVLRSQRVDVVSAMAIAGLINLAMLAVAAESLSNLPDPVDTIEGAYEGSPPPWARPPRCCSGWPCSPPASPPPGSVPTRARWSCRDSCVGGSPWSSGDW